MIILLGALALPASIGFIIHSCECDDPKKSRRFSVISVILLILFFISFLSWARIVTPYKQVIQTNDYKVVDYGEYYDRTFEVKYNKQKDNYYATYAIDSYNSDTQYIIPAYVHVHLIDSSEASHVTECVYYEEWPISNKAICSFLFLYNPEESNSAKVKYDVYVPTEGTYHINK